MTEPKAHLEIPEDNLTLMQEYAENNDEPIVMVNLMQLRDTAQYEDDSAPTCSGSEAFERYKKESAEVRNESGAKLIWSGRAQLMPIGPSEKAWDMVALVWYPNAQAYLNMKATEAYQVAHGHRRASLHDSRLIMTTPN